MSGVRKRCPYLRRRTVGVLASRAGVLKAIGERYGRILGADVEAADMLTGRNLRGRQGQTVRIGRFLFH
jgi:hypothetical protein